MTSDHAELRVEGTAQEGRIVESLSPQQWIPQRRDRPRKKRKLGKLKSQMSHVHDQSLKN
jgi:hypothetical protein